MSAEWPGLTTPSAGALASAGLALCVAALAWRRRFGAPPPLAMIWTGTSAILVAVAVAELFNLELLLGAVGRCAMLHEALYAERNPVQLAGMAALALGTPLVVVALVRGLPLSLRPYGLIIALAAALVVFLGWRALSFHNFDSIVHARLFGLTVNRVVELALLSFLLVAVANPPKPDHS